MLIPLLSTKSSILNSAVVDTCAVPAWWLQAWWGVARVSKVAGHNQGP